MAKNEPHRPGGCCRLPERGLRRAAARQGLELVNSGYGNYGASTTKKSMRGWQFAGGDAKATSKTTSRPCGSGAVMLTWAFPLRPVR